jgi:hypothetical protein
MSLDADAKRELLAALLGQRARETSAVCSQSYGHKALWFLYQADMRSAAYNTAFTARISGRVDVAALPGPCSK